VVPDLAPLEHRAVPQCFTTEGTEDTETGKEEGFRIQIRSPSSPLSVSVPSVFSVVLPVLVPGYAALVMDTRILCIGNELVRDDGVGIRVGRILRELPLPDGARVELALQLGFDLLDVVASAERIVLVDATSTGQPVGTCVTLEGRAIERYSAGTSASHTIGIAELMALAHRLAPPRAPASLFFVGIEGAAFGEYGTQLSREVAAAIPTAVEAVLRIIGADAALIVQARKACQRAAQQVPSVSALLSR
jgi:hydrogenase maturation protease